MANKNLIPVRIKIDGKWFNVREGWAGKLELEDSGKIAPTVEFTAKEPYAHMNDFWFVYDTDENKIGEIDINNKSRSGRVEDFEIPSGSAPASNEPRVTKPPFEKPDDMWGWIGVILVFLISPYIELFVTGFWNKYTAERKDWWGTLGRMFLFGLIIGGIVISASDANATAIIIVSILTLLPMVVVSFSRVRDAGKPWWWALIPGANFIICGFFPSEY